MEMNDIQQLMKDCIARSKKLSSWELDFVISLETTFLKRKHISLDQYKMLNTIWDKVT